MLLSENLRTQIAENPEIEIVGTTRELPFDGTGNLVSPFLGFAVA
jgi:hypothetical protein